MKEELTHRPPQHKNAKTYNADTGEVEITKAKYDGKGQGYGGQQKKVSNVNNNNKARTI